LLERGAWRTREGSGAEDRVLTRARKLLDKQFTRLRKRARYLAEADAQERHRIRITTKKLRYMSEFFDSLVKGAKRRRRFKSAVRSLETIQACLGEVHDAEARGEFLESLVTNIAGVQSSNRATITAFAAGVYTASERPKEKKLIRKAVRAFKNISGRKSLLVTA
jgi:triphosphatase